MSSDLLFPVLHGLALRRRADLAALERTTGLTAEHLEAGLADAAAQGLAISARGSWLLAPKGAAWLDERYPAEFGALRADADLHAQYDRFEIVNREVKGFVTEWQTRTIGGKQVPNDHTDEAHDAKLLARLGEIHERAERWIGHFSAKVPPVRRYVERLADAIERAEGGAPEWVSGVRCDSYHTVWFEMHEDLLRRLARTREE